MSVPLHWLLTVYKATSSVCGRDQRLDELKSYPGCISNTHIFLVITERTKIKRCNSVPTVVRTSKPGWVSVGNILKLGKKPRIISFWSGFLFLLSACFTSESFLTKNWRACSSIRSLDSVKTFYRTLTKFIGDLYCWMVRSLVPLYMQNPLQFKKCIGIFYCIKKFVLRNMLLMINNILKTDPTVSHSFVFPESLACYH